MPIPERLASALGDRYHLEKELGRGGAAVVYLAEDLKHHRQVAVNVLRSELAASLGPQRFLNEIDVAAKFTHPHILPLHDSGEADGFLYYVTPFIEGESLRQTLDREKQLPIEKAVRITQQVAAALDYAHRHGIVHRDIKPENILLQDGQSMVADFGIARALTTCGGALTETGVVVGTPLYMSPEHLAGRTDLDGRADIYALGCVLYEMLAGEAPFAAPTAEATLAKRLTDAAPRVSRVRPAVPEAVDAALAKALARTPADRFATAARFAEALDITSTARTAAATLESTHPRRAWRRRAAVAFALVLASIGAFLGLQFRPRGNPVPTVPRLVVLPFENLGAPEQE